MNEGSDRGFETLHPAARWGMRLGAATFALVSSGGLLFVVGMIARANELLSPLSALAAVPVLLVAQGLAWRFARARFDRTRFRLDDHGLLIERGVFWRSVTRVPRSRVQHTDINRGPLDRHLGLAGLRVYTAGTLMASVGLEGLPAERALELRDELINTEDDAV